jgi:UDP:flavonoid glycosyltransferase YjiC (YdhE family)
MIGDSTWDDARVSRFLIVPLPLASHLNPALAIGQALVHSGHSVSWCGPESELRPLVGPDATIHPTGKRTYRRYAESGMAAVRVLWDGYLIPLTRFILEPVDRAITEYKPDVVVADQYALAAGLLAHRHGVPWATLCTGVMELTPPPDLAELPGFVRERLARAATMARVLDAPDPRFSPSLVIALTTAALTGSAPLPKHTVLTGPALGSRPDTEFPWHAWDPDTRHVLVTVGTFSEHMAADFYTRMVAALEGTAQAVFIGDALGDNVIAVDRVPMLELLPKLDAVVCHGGMGTVTEALAHGVPLVVAPMRHDQPVIARQVTEAGAGIEVPMSASPADLAAAVRSVLDEPSYRRNARRIAEDFRAAGGATAAAAGLAALVAGV